jgi:hypothetical protein
MNNHKTTIAGAALAGLYVLQDVQLRGAALSDWQTYAIPVAIAVLGYLVADAKPAQP